MQGSKPPLPAPTDIPAGGRPPPPRAPSQQEPGRPAPLGNNFSPPARAARLALADLCRAVREFLTAHSHYESGAPGVAEGVGWVAAPKGRADGREGTATEIGGGPAGPPVRCVACARAGPTPPSTNPCQRMPLAGIVPYVTPRRLIPLQAPRHALTRPGATPWAARSRLPAAAAAAVARRVATASQAATRRRPSLAALRCRTSIAEALCRCYAAFSHISVLNERLTAVAGYSRGGEGGMSRTNQVRGAA
jgi:hypothetical protein